MIADAIIPAPRNPTVKLLSELIDDDSTCQKVRIGGCETLRQSQQAKNQPIEITKKSFLSFFSILHYPAEQFDFYNSFMLWAKGQRGTNIGTQHNFH
jgi:hypothetical protein